MAQKQEKISSLNKSTYSKIKFNKSNYSSSNQGTLCNSILICNANESYQCGTLSKKNGWYIDCNPKLRDVDQQPNIRLVPPPRMDSLPRYNHDMLKAMISEAFQYNRSKYCDDKSLMFNSKEIK